MCKLSLNIVPNVYNSLQSSFLSLAWPWPDRSLHKGNQWEWWDPQQGPLPGLGEVGHFPKGTSGSAGSLDWGPMWLGSQSTCHPNASPTPWCPLSPLGAPNATLYHLYPSGPWVPKLLASPQWTLTSPTPQILPYGPQFPLTPLGAPLWHLYPFWPQSTYTSCKPTNAPTTPTPRLPLMAK